MSYLTYLVTTQFGGERRSAPIQDVSVNGTIHDTIAEYTLVQTYLNPLDSAPVEAAYAFPLYEGVAVSGFEAEVDGRKIIGKVEEKAAAKKDYEEAVKAGKVASLLEQEKPDVFQAFIGNIPPAKTVTIRLTLISEIKHDAEENQIRFVLPTTIAPRYGDALDLSIFGHHPDLASSSSACKLSVEISCAMSKQVASIQSPSHTIRIDLGSSQSPTKVSLTGSSSLDRDLVLIVQAVGLDAPRALVEVHPEDGTHALALTFAPRFALNALKSCELIFLVDRSGSMGSGTQIQQAGEALELFLRSIPSEEHYINIIGFGSHHNSLFPKSVEYSAESLRTTTKYAQALRADMGGTELLGAFQEVFERRRKDVPTQVFLLTDGQIWNVESLVQCIKEAVEEAEKLNSSIRVFTLGVGASVSHHLIESVARAGGGYSQLVVQGERMEKKVVNMLKAALVPPVTNASIQWTNADVSGEDDFEMVEAAEEAADSKPVPVTDPKGNPINLFSTEVEVPTRSPPPPAALPEVVIPILQAPFKVPALNRGVRFTMYSILPSSEMPVPKEIILRGSSPDGPVELKVPVESVRDGDTILHSLAARTMVRDLEEGASCIHALKANASIARDEQMLKNLGIRVMKEGQRLPKRLSEHEISKLTKQKILELALKYRISSKYTSWVAIDADSHSRIVQQNAEMAEGQMECRSGFRTSHSATMVGGLPGKFVQPRMRMQQMGMQQMAMPQMSMLLPSAAPPPYKMQLMKRKGSRSTSRSEPLAGTPVNDSATQACAFGTPPSESLNRAFSASSPAFGSTTQMGTSSLFGCLGQALSKFPERVRRAEPVSKSPPRASPRPFPSVPSTPDSLPEDLFNSSLGEQAATDPHSRLRSLLQHQQFDGSFPLEPELAALLSSTVEEMKSSLKNLRKKKNNDNNKSLDSLLPLSKTEWETLWATCVVVQFLRKQLPELMEEWELVVEKAEKRVAAMAKSDAGVVAALQQAASEMVKKNGAE